VFVIPAQAGIQLLFFTSSKNGVPAFAGTTETDIVL